MKKILSFIIAIFMCGMVTTVTFPANASALDCEKTILGLRPWYSGLLEEEKIATDAFEQETCTVRKPKEGELPSYVWRIILNVSADLALVVGYAAIIFVIFGGYKYIMSTGDPGKTKEAKTIITNALIGLIIALLATVIVNTIIGVLGNAAK